VVAPIDPVFPSIAKLPVVRWACVLVPGLVLYFAPLPALSDDQRHLLAVFVSTIVALVVRPMPMSVSVLLSMTLLALTGTITSRSPPSCLPTPAAAAGLWRR
jgi:hypothetical protein